MDRNSKNWIEHSFATSIQRIPRKDIISLKTVNSSTSFWLGCFSKDSFGSGTSLKKEEIDSEKTARFLAKNS